MPEQLQMIWPEEKLRALPAVLLPSDYTMRTWQPGDDDEFVRLMQLAGFDGWNLDSLRNAKNSALPDGIFLAVHTPSDALAATAMATHLPAENHPFGGELGWVAGHPDHRGRGLGMAVCTAVMQRYASAGYRRVYLKTDDWRLPAIKVYLKLGFLPFLFSPDVEQRWQEVCGELDWPIDINGWPRC